MSYCKDGVPFYGAYMLPHFDTSLCTTRFVWHLNRMPPWITHNNMLCHVAGVIDPTWWFACKMMSKVYIKWLLCLKLIQSVPLYSMMGRNSSYSIMGTNILTF